MSVFSPRAIPDGFEQRAAQVAGTRLHWLEREGAGDPLLLIPGVGMSSAAYTWLVGEVPIGRRVLVVDPPGCGGSEALAESMSSQAQAQHLAVWLYDKGIERIDVVGHSLGAVTAARLVAGNPDLAASLVLLSPSPDGRWPHLLGHVLALARGMWREAPRTVVQATRDYISADARVLSGFRDELGRSAASVMGGVCVPVSVVRGARDRVVSEEWCRQLAAASGGRVHTVRGAAHGLPQQRPAAVARLIQQLHAAPSTALGACAKECRQEGPV